MRSLSPFRIGRRRDERGRAHRVSVQHRLGPCAADGPWPCQSARAGVLRPSHRPVGGARHPPRGHVVPLGSSGGAGRSRRMAQPGLGRLVRGIRAGGRPGAGGSGRFVGHHQRTLGGERRRVPARDPRSRTQEPRGSAAGQSQPAPGPRRGRAGDPGRRRTAGGTGREPRAEDPGLGSAPGPGGHPARRRVYEPAVPGCGVLRTLSRGIAGDFRIRLADVSRHRFRRHSSAARFSGHQLLHPRGDPLRLVRHAAAGRKRATAGEHLHGPG